VGGDGRFDALLPSRVYSVINVNGAGYKYDAMERWGWDYDLTRDRVDEFAIGRTEIYGMRAFDLNGPLPTIFVMFRPTALSRALRFDADGDGFISDDETKATLAAMKDSPTVIGPALEAADMKVWLNGNEEAIVRVDRIPSTTATSGRCSTCCRSSRRFGLRAACGTRSKWRSGRRRGSEAAT